VDGNIIANLPTANNHVTTKEYVDSIRDDLQSQIDDLKNGVYTYSWSESQWSACSVSC